MLNKFLNEINLPEPDADADEQELELGEGVAAGRCGGWDWARASKAAEATDWGGYK